MAGYVRQDVTDQIANGNTVNAIPLDQEFDAITSAFTSVSGHRHNGSVGEGAPITVLGPTQNVVVSSNSVTPSTTNVVDLGSTTVKFKDLWIAGVANVPSLIATTADINAGTVDATAIGATIPSTGAFTTLSTSGAATLATATVGGVAVATASNTQTLTNKTIDLTNNTLIATSAQIDAAVIDNTGTGPLVFGSNPSFTGIPSAPTAAVNTNTTQIATTAYVVAQIADDAPAKTGAGASGSWAINAATATLLQTPRTINGALFSGGADIVSLYWGTSRTITVGVTGKAVDGSANVSWTLAEIGAQTVNPQLTGLSSLTNTPGLVTQIAANSFAVRSVAVGAGTGLSIVDGNAIAGNPTISGVTQIQGVWDAGASTTESVISPAKLASTIIAQKPVPSASQSTAAGTSFTFSSIPSWVSRVTVIFNNISLDGADSFLVQLGTGGGIVGAGYSSLGGSYTAAATATSSSSSGMIVRSGGAGENFTGAMVINKTDPSSNTWVSSYSGAGFPTTVGNGGGIIALGATLTQLRLTRTGANNFDNGSVSIMWE